MPITFVELVNENSSCRLRFLIKDFDGTPIAPTNIITAVINVFNKTDDAAIGATDRDVSSDFTTDTTRNFSYVVPFADNVIISTVEKLTVETHVYKLVITVDAGAGVTLNHEEEFYVQVEKHRK